MLKDRKRLIFNTLTSYACLFFELISFFLITRLLIDSLTRGEYGFWSLLWMVMGYSLVFDFGFGVSLQKYSAEYTVHRDDDRMSDILSTIGLTYIGLGVVISLGVFLLSRVLDTVFNLNVESAAEVERLMTVFLIFGLGATATFSIGYTAEVLTGLGRIDLRNFIRALNTVFNLAGIWLICSSGDNVLLRLAVFTVFLNLLTYVIMGMVAFKFMPKVKVSLKFFKKSLYGELVSFSLYAYLTTFMHLIIYKTDQLLLGVTLGVTAVAVYQIGTKLPNLLFRLTDQFVQNVGPVTAALTEARDTQLLKRFTINSYRFVVLSGSAMAVTILCIHKEMLAAWLRVGIEGGSIGSSQEEAELIYLITVVMAINVFIVAAFRSIGSRTMLMGGREKILALLSILEGVLNLGLSLVFIVLFDQGIAGVVYGTIISSVTVNVFMIFPYSCRHAHVRPVKLFVDVFLTSMLTAALLGCGILAAKNFLPPLEQWQGLKSLLYFVACLAPAWLVFVLAVWRFFLKEEERGKILTKLKLKRA